MEYQKYLADQAHINIAIAARDLEERQAMESLARVMKEKDCGLQRFKDLENGVKNLKAQIPPLKNSIDRMMNEKSAIKNDQKIIRAAVEDLKREEDICMSAYLKVVMLLGEPQSFTLELMQSME